ncbi:ferrous iron transport protein B [Runella sp. MFBS21]|uniref:ferrous iron transport protein B n=1 Tax=Runella sp. MFBS21 TaxID=3034018 RepID=UPI0023FA384C|nr:ferrous iron transport protein B [Runella sp. MFBS21]MDF7817799.1 ferrous iron transport protein B [Runella sp. MFBS21]
MKKTPIIALIGNPNSGKSSLFNQLTGLRQKVGNFPSVTVEKKSGPLMLEGQTEATVVDLPGLYSLYPKALDEQVVIDILANPHHEDYPDVVVVVADASNLKRNLLIFTQVADLGLPVVLALNMLDVAEDKNLQVNAVKLAMKLNVPVVRINARVGEGLDNLKKAIVQTLEKPTSFQKYYFDPAEQFPELIKEVKKSSQLANNYLALHYVQQHDIFSFLSTEKRVGFDKLIEKYDFKESGFQAAETMHRYAVIDGLVKESVKTTDNFLVKPLWTQRLDNILLHPFWGYAVFFLVLLTIFQAVFTLASYPMDMIDAGIASFNDWLKETLPPGLFTDLLTDGLVAGIGGVVIFIPQIAFLFLLVALLEESGYMARVMVIMDKLMRRFGLNGKSVVPLISGVACAVPAIMSARSIGNRKERLLTILVTPLMSCSARLPIFTILIALVVPATPVLGFFTLQGLTLMGLYLLGLLSALLSAWVIKGWVANTEKGYFVMEMPTYKVPRWYHVGLAVWDSVKSFVTEAGKIIVAISIILWVLATYGPGDSIEKAEEQVKQENPMLQGTELDNAIAAQKLENSYAGHFGKFIEPAIAPLGYDWKIGIALLASFAAREVFVGTMSTIYSIGSEADEDNGTIKARMRAEINPKTGKPMYTPALAFSLLIFYVFAMMCMSTIATVYRETHGWKWPLIQLAYMTVLAYGLAFLTYQLLS